VTEYQACEPGRVWAVQDEPGIDVGVGVTLLVGVPVGVIVNVPVTTLVIVEV
jgi:hypothetical protein